jgi:ribonuclease E
MDEGRNNRAVEKRLKEALKIDRARIQVGRISSFGLLEMSRQRMRAGVLEGSSETCPHCNGSGMLRSVESRALHVLRQIDERAGKFSEGTLTVHVPEDVATYLLNNKRTQLLDIETQIGIRVMVQADRDLTAMEMAFTLPDQTESEGTMRMEGDPAALAYDAALAKPKRNRRRRSNKAQQERTEDGVAEDADETDEETEPLTADSEDGDEGKTKRRRRRGRRGGRRRRRSEDGEVTASDENSDDTEVGTEAEAIAADAAADADIAAQAETPEDDQHDAETGDTAPSVEMDAEDAQEVAEATEDTTGDTAEDSVVPDEAPDEDTDSELVMAGADAADDADAGPTRKGWWRRS